MKKSILSLLITLIPALIFAQGNFKIYQKPTADVPPLGRYVLLDDGNGNYTKATLQSIINQVQIPEVEGDGYVDGLFWSESSKVLTVMQNGALNQAVALTGLNYTLPSASASVRGGVRIGSGINLNGDVISVTPSSYTLPTASASTLGGVRVGTGLSISSGILSGFTGDYDDLTDRPWDNISASTIRASKNVQVLGLVGTGTRMVVASDAGILSTQAIPSGGGTYTLPAATASTRGGIRVGSGLSISGDVLSATATSYSLPAATASVRGGIKVGNGLAVTSDVLRLNLTPSVVERSYPSSSVGLTTASSVDVFDETFTVTSGALTFIDVNVASNTLTSADVRLTLYINGAAINSEYEYLPTGASTTPRGNINISHRFIASSTSLNVRIEGRLYSGSNHNVIPKSMRVTQIK